MSVPGAAAGREGARAAFFLAVAGAVLGGFWPVMVWWWRRTGDDSDEPLGVLALVAALGWMVAGRARLEFGAAGLLAAAVCMVGVRLLAEAMALPMLVLGLACVVALVLALRLWRLPGVTVLLSLALPWVATLQFMAGYPLRVAVALAAEKGLRLAGVAVTREGTDLWHQGVAVGVDAPCSGIRMLWFTLFAAGFLAAQFRLRWLPTLALLAAAGGLALVANAVRATVLFFPEAGLVQWPHWTHEGTGLLLFLPCLVLLMLLARRWEENRRMGVISPGERATVPGRALAVLGVTCLAVAVSWLGQEREAKAETADSVAPVAWPETFRGMVLEPLPLSVREEHFEAGFPGALARFRCGEGEVILRRVDRATRMLHPAQDCFQAAGFEMQRVSGEAVPGDGLWQVWRAQRGEEPPLVVCEQIRSRTGELFTDVSAWYWSALRHPEDGPWLAVTWVRRAEEP